MTQQELIRFLNRVHAWMPRNNPIRREVRQVVQHLGGKVSEVMSDEEYQKYVADKQQPLANEPEV
jgi:chemotaxis regulatin CheY-phosphate phosphatase CheZ